MTDLVIRRGLTYSEALAYVGVKRRTFDAEWRPRLVAMREGSSLIFDRADLDRLFDERKARSASDQAANDADDDPAHNATRNGRPATRKGEPTWAKQPGESIPNKTGPGKLTSGGEVLGFAAAASIVSKKRKGG